jgi:hypothetical protein
MGLACLRAWPSIRAAAKAAAQLSRPKAPCFDQNAEAQDLHAEHGPYIRVLLCLSPWITSFV